MTDVASVYPTYIALFAIALVVTLLFTPIAGKIAWCFDSVDYPSRRRVNAKPTPRMGGVAIMVGLMAAFGGCLLLSQALGWESILPPSSRHPVNFVGVGVAILLMFLVGAVDDVKNLTPYTKFIWQVVAASLATAFGVVVGDLSSPFDESLIDLGWIAYPFSVLYLVSFANIINLIDGVDGLASGIIATCSAALCILSMLAGYLSAAALAAALVGATLGFLRWNVNPAKIFLGDSGSLLLGFCLGIASLMGNVRVTGITALVVPMIMVGVPILDTFAAIVRRSRVGISIMTPDKGHVHHRLLNRGYGQKAVTSIIVGCTVLLCLCSVVIIVVSPLVRVGIVIALITMSFLYGRHLNIFVPVVRKRFDPETGMNEVVPIGEVDEEEDYSSDEIAAAIVGGVDAGAPNNDDLPKTKRPLRILAVSQHYWPEPFAIPYVCEGLAAMGHQVTVLTGTPNYPDGDIYEGYEHGAHPEQVHNGVKIIRAKIVPRGREVWQRVVNYYSFSNAATKIARSMSPDFDVVFSFQTSPVMMSRPALAYGKKNGVPVLLWCQDLWPECLTVGNIKRGSVVYNSYARVSRTIYSSADVLAVSSRTFGEYYRKELGMEDVQPLYLPQYAEDIFDEDAPPCDEYDHTKINLTFAGNVGVAQAVNTFVEAGHYLAGDDRFALHVVGSGSELETLKKYKEEIGATCVTFHGRHPLADMPSFYDSSDAMVATFQDNSILGYTLPRKITSYMAAGRPILGTVVGEARTIIEEAGCGLCCAAEDPVGLAEICRRFADMTPQEREEMGARGRHYYEEHFAKERFYSILEDALQELKGTTHDS